MIKKTLFSILILFFSFATYAEQIKPIPNNIDIENFKFDSFKFSTTKEDLISIGFQCKEDICNKNVGRLYKHEVHNFFNVDLIDVQNSTKIAFINDKVSLISADKIIPAFNKDCISVVESIKNKLEKDFKMNLYNPIHEPRWRLIDKTALLGTTIFKNDKNLSTKIKCHIIEDEETDTKFLYTKFEFYNDNSVADALF